MTVEVNREWQDLQDKYNLLNNGRITSCSISVDQPMDHIRRLGDRMSHAFPRGPRNISFRIEGHIIQQDHKTCPTGFHLDETLGKCVPNTNPIARYSRIVGTGKFIEPTKRKYKRKEYSIMVKDKRDGHIKNETLTVARKRIGRVIKKKKK